MNDELKIKNNELGGKMNYRYRNDEEMKDSGVEWIGKIPKEWSISRISKEFIIRNEKVSDKDFAPLSVTKQGILPQLDSVAKSDNGDNRKRVCVGDFVINSRADRKGSCGTSSYDGSVSLICNVLTPKYLDSQYIHSLFRNYYFSEEFYRWGSGIVDDLWSTNIEKMKKINIPKPNKNEDKKIAKFLDKKIAQFDFIISKKEALIEKLEEAKKSLISEVVTGKVRVVKTNDGYELVERKKEEMKDSEISRIGSIPTYWNISKLKYVSNIIMGQSPDSSDVKDLGNTLFMQGSSEFGKMFPSPKMYCDNSNKVSRIGDILMSVRAPVGEVNISNKPYAIGRGLCSIKAVNISSGYLWYFMMKSKDDFRFYSNGTTFDAITINIINNFILTVPSKNEENMIVEFLNKETSKIENLVINIKTVIEKLKEAKQSLISEAVTGKIEILD